MSEAGWTDQTVEAGAGVKGGGTIILFYPRQVENKFESKAQNRPVFMEKIYIKKIVGGDNTMNIDRPMRDSDRDEFPKQWEYWEKTRSTRIPGIPIEHWHSISETQKAEFKALQIFTIEQFADLPDSAAEKIRGFHDLRAKAKVFLGAGKDAELLAKLRLEMDQKLAERDAEIQELKAAILWLKADKPKSHHAKKPPPRAATSESLTNPQEKVTA